MQPAPKRGNLTLRKGGKRSKKENAKDLLFMVRDAAEKEGRELDAPRKGRNENNKRLGKKRSNGFRGVRKQRLR